MTSSLYGNVESVSANDNMLCMRVCMLSETVCMNKIMLEYMCSIYVAVGWSHHSCARVYFRGRSRWRSVSLLWLWPLQGRLFR